MERLLWKKCLFGEEVLILGSGEFRILGTVYRIDSSIRIGIFVYNFRKMFSDLKNVYSN